MCLFYSENLFDEIAAYIKDQGGMGREEYRVASVGLHPASEYNGGVMLGEESNVVFRDFQVDSRIMKEMGCRYLLSAGEIMEPELTGLVLCGIFEREDGYYRIYLYEVAG